MSSEQQMILSTSDEAATYRTDLKGWVSRDGLYFGEDERTARYSGCTHVPCQGCSKPAPKGRVVCDACYVAREREKFGAKERRPWDGEAMLYSEVLDRYFTDPEDAIDWVENQDEEGHTLETLRLVLCEPTKYREIDPNDYYVDDLPEDGEVDNAIAKAFKELNAKIRAHSSPASWFPGKYALDLSGLFAPTSERAR